MGNKLNKESREYIKYVFNEDEKKEMAGNMAQSNAEKESLEQKLKEVSKQIKADIEAAQTKISTLSRHYNQGYEYKTADCILTYDFDFREVLTHRKDNGDFISRRTMREEELQQKMFGDPHAITAPEIIDEVNKGLFENEVLEKQRV